ncbi:vesicle-fusing ATPase [Salpingoeca rosetta]|uniref:Vesicle-fusing ATPase n=1 Tax=Salpingoeca rosetta (strain ATCC 50818 / BSB-021) TaxID=946362 RepID=F2TYA0_SALR5|nr:vesicle-fusing ATPase [Salpingoeca rosetta]EGD76359.1 vesicle-fusing ATPase [Salpingoeca rosetta]|eukprot:XP_004998534.1 vesicle-fusing ATPase [Salpingoeca rosetta]
MLFVCSAAFGSQMFEMKLVKSSSTQEAVRNRLVVSTECSVPAQVRHVYVHPQDGGRFAQTLERSPVLKPTQVAANVAQRKWAKLTLGEDLKIEPISGPFDGVGLATLELDFWKKSASQTTRYKIEEMATQFRESFANMILSPGQLILFSFKPSNAKEVLLSVTVKELFKFDEGSLMGPSLHVIIMDELDAICRQRGSVQSGTGVHDSIVNQLLSKIDGVEALNNILLIGMTNRLDMIDEALLRPGRLELKMQIGLPDTVGREQIFNIHTKKMRENKMLAEDVNIKELAGATKNFSGAEIAGVCRSAASFASNRCIKFDNTVEVKTEELSSIKVTREDFLNAVQEVIPAFGAATEELDDCARNGIVTWGEPVQRVLSDGELLIQQAENSTRTPLVSVLLSGQAGSGKTALAAALALRSSFPLVKLISPEQMVGYSEFAKVNKINKVFEDAYKSRLSVIVIDDIERLLDYSAMGNRFSNVILQALLVLFKKAPPKGHKLFLIGTTSKRSVLDLMGITEAFSQIIQVEQLTEGSQVMKVIDDLQPFPERDIEQIRTALSHGSQLRHSMLDDTVEISIGIKKLYMLIEMARQAEEQPGEKFLESLFDECRYNRRHLD